MSENRLTIPIRVINVIAPDKALFLSMFYSTNADLSLRPFYHDCLRRKKITSLPITIESVSLPIPVKEKDSRSCL